MADEDDFLSPEEERILAFQYDNQSKLKLANLGFDMDRFVHTHPVGKQLVETALDQLHNNMIALIDMPDLNSPEAKEAHVEARANKRLIDYIVSTLDAGRSAALELADEAELEEQEHAEEND